jgi:hypothetical protein
MGYNLAVKGEIPTKKVTPDASKRRLKNNKCGITTQIGARSAPYKTNVSSPRRQGRNTNNESYHQALTSESLQKTKA